MEAIACLVSGRRASILAYIALHGGFSRGQLVGNTEKTRKKPLRGLQTCNVFGA